MRFFTFPRLRPSSLKLEMRECLDESAFHRILICEQKRATRSGRALLLMFVNVEHVLQAHQNDHVQSQLLSALCQSTRETDIIGWYRKSARLGVLFAEIHMPDGKAPEGVIRAKVIGALRAKLDGEKVNQIETEFLVLPEACDRAGNCPPASETQDAEADTLLKVS